MKNFNVTLTDVRPSIAEFIRQFKSTCSKLSTCGSTFVKPLKCGDELLLINHTTNDIYIGHTNCRTIAMYECGRGTCPLTVRRPIWKDTRCALSLIHISEPTRQA